MRFIRDSLTTFAAQITAAFLALLVSIVIARVLGPSGKGAYSLVLLVCGILCMIGSLGIGIASVYLGGKKKYGWTDLAANSLASALVIGGLLALGLVGYVAMLDPSFLRDVEFKYIVMAALAVPLGLLTTYFGFILLGQGRIGEYNLLQLVPALLTLLLILVLLLGFGMGLFGAVVGWVTTASVAAILSILLVRRRTPFNLSFRLRVLKDSIKFGAQASLGNVIQFLNLRLDMAMVAYFMSLDDVGYYSVAVALAEVLWYFPGAVGTIVFARTPGLSESEVNRTTPQICRITLFATILLAVVLFGLSGFVVRLLFGSAFLPALRPLWILLPGVVALSACKVLSNELGGRGRPAIWTIAAGVSLIVNVSLNLYLIPRMGITGAALASTVSYTVTAVVVVVAFLRISKSTWYDTLVVKRQDLVLVMGILRKRGGCPPSTAESPN